MLIIGESSTLSLDFQVISQSGGINSTKYFIHNNHLGSVTLTTDANGVVQQGSQYLPYGAPANAQNSELQPYGFSAKERDASELMYFEARYYDPLSARFISPDPLFAAEMEKCIESMIECNVYQYTGNNPVVRVDLTGLETDPILGGMTVRPVSWGSINKSRFRMVTRTNPDGSSRTHHGFDGSAEIGTPLRTMLSGEVIDVVDSFKNNNDIKNSFGNRITIESNVDGKIIRNTYSHLSPNGIRVLPGDIVKEGDFIGLTGNSGNAAGLTNKGQDHVHIESAVGGASPSRANNDARINPEQFMQTKFDDNGSAIVDPPDAVDLTELF